MARTLKRPPRTRPDNRITADMLRELMETRILKKPQKMPAETELTELASVLDHWRCVYQNEEILRKRRKLQDQALTALFALTKLDQANLVAAKKDGAPSAVLRELCSRLATLESIAPALAELPMSYGFTGWKGLIDVLPKDFATLMKSTNPTFAPKISNNSRPVARFIAAVAPFITGEHPTVGSVATQLKTKPKKARNLPRARRANG